MVKRKNSWEIKVNTRTNVTLVEDQEKLRVLLRTRRSSISAKSITTEAGRQAARQANWQQQQGKKPSSVSRLVGCTTTRNGFQKE